MKYHKHMLHYIKTYLNLILNVKKFVNIYINN